MLNINHSTAEPVWLENRYAKDMGERVSTHARPIRMATHLPKTNGPRHSRCSHTSSQLDHSSSGELARQLRHNQQSRSRKAKKASKHTGEHKFPSYSPAE